MDQELSEREDGGMQMLAVLIAAAWAVVAIYCAAKASGLV